MFFLEFKSAEVGTSPSLECEEEAVCIVGKRYLYGNVGPDVMVLDVSCTEDFTVPLSPYLDNASAVAPDAYGRYVGSLKIEELKACSRRGVMLQI